MDERPSPGTTADLRRCLDRAKVLVECGTRACESIRSLGYEFGADRDPQKKIERFTQDLMELAELLAEAAGCESPDEDSLVKSFASTRSELRQFRGFVEDVLQELGRENSSPASLLGLFRRYARRFSEESSYLATGISQCRQERLRLRQELDRGDQSG
jgi:hypothetical protein